ncbi:hypothetical protein [Kineosporia sp. A_224]|uniref:hypothetical protein n=1 Tax=Kineosporia sp. A_224 TaxID=1962180 RepID=UPI000B4A6D9F|nr:hypothetical protein [Kineosporia sp. A_224]
MTAPDLVAWLALEHRLAVCEQTLRQWASRGKVARHPKDDAGRTRHDPVEVAGFALEQRSQRTPRTRPA